MKKWVPRRELVNYKPTIPCGEDWVQVKVPDAPETERYEVKTLSANSPYPFNVLGFDRGGNHYVLDVALSMPDMLGFEFEGLKELVSSPFAYKMNTPQVDDCIALTDHNAKGNYEPIHCIAVHFRRKA